MLINVAEETVSTEVMEQSLTFEFTHNRSFQLLNHLLCIECSVKFCYKGQSNGNGIRWI